MRDEEIPFNFDVEMNRFFKERCGVLEAALLAGGAKDFTHYKEWVGERNGLLKAQARMTELINNWNNRG